MAFLAPDGGIRTKGGLPLARLASALLFSVAPFVGPARAACMLAGAGTLECTGNISPGGVDNSFVNGDVHIQAGATVVGGTMTTNAGVSMGPSGGLLNDGSITGNVNAVTSQGALVLTNNGVIRGSGAAGVIAQGAISGTNNGLIQAQTWGVYATTSLQLENNGRVTAGIALRSQTLDLKNNGALTGSVTGIEITGADPGGAKVVNDGTITVTDLNGAAISAAGNLEITNRAQINGGVRAFGINATNSGTINGQSGAAFLSVGPFNLTNSGNITGVAGAALVTGPATITNNGAMTSTGQSATTIAATDITISNNARISSAGRYSSAIAVANDASITNSSLISSPSDSIAIKVGATPPFITTAKFPPAMPSIPPSPPPPFLSPAMRRSPTTASFPRAEPARSPAYSRPAIRPSPTRAAFRLPAPAPLRSPATPILSSPIPAPSPRTAPIPSASVRPTMRRSPTPAP